MLVDETHHLLPTDGNPTALALAKELDCMIYVTVHPDQIEPSILSTVDMLFALGKSPEQTVKTYCAAIHQPLPILAESELEPGRVLMWNRASQDIPLCWRSPPAQ